MISDVVYLFVYLVAIFISSLLKYPVFCWYFAWAIFVLLLNYRRFLYILDINFVLGRWFVNVLCHSGGYLFILLIISSQYRSFLVRYSSTCVLLILLLMLLMSNPRNHCQDRYQECFSSFLQGVFQLQVLFVFNPFGVDFVCSLRKESNLILLPVNIQFLLHYLLNIFKIYFFFWTSYFVLGYSR